MHQIKAFRKTNIFYGLVTNYTALTIKYDIYIVFDLYSNTKNLILNKFC